MARMNYPHAPDGCRPGERKLFNALNRYLPEAYTVYFEPTLFGRKQSARPDFVVLGAEIGLAVIEVKDWSLDRIATANRDTFQLRLGGELEVRTNPEKQVEQHRRALVREIEQYRRTDPDKYQTLLQPNGPYRGKLAVPISYLVALPHITRSAWEASGLQATINPACLIFGPELDETLLKRLQARSLFPARLSPAQLDTLKWMIYPEIRVPYRQGQLFTLDPEQIGIARLDTYLPPDNQLLARKPQAKLVRGVVGSGKTLILLYRAKFLSEQNPNWRILVLTYNKSLRDYLRQLFVRIGGDPARVEIANFHQWCRELLPPEQRFRSPHDGRSQRGLIVNILQEAGDTEFTPEFLAEEFNWIKERLDYRQWAAYVDPQQVKRSGRGRGLGGDEAAKRAQIYDLFRRYQARLQREQSGDWADVPVNTLRAIDIGQIEAARYHAVLIDEAQDFTPAWFRVAFRMVKPETELIFIVGDGAQKIYSRDFTWKELGLGITARNSFILQKSYRSTQEILDVALDTIRDSQSLIEELRSAGDSLLEPDRAYAEFRHGPLPVLLSFDSPEKEYAGVANQIRTLLQQGFQPHDIVILQRRRRGLDQMAAELRRQGIAATVVKGRLDMAEPAVKICTLHSAKGLEFDVVFICGLENFAVDAAADDYQTLLDQERKLLYVGMTRARRMLYVTYNGTAPAWILTRFAGKVRETRSEI